VIRWVTLHADGQHLDAGVVQPRDEGLGVVLVEIGRLDRIQRTDERRAVGDDDEDLPPFRHCGRLLLGVRHGFHLQRTGEQIAEVGAEDALEGVLPVIEEFGHTGGVEGHVNRHPEGAEQLGEPVCCGKRFGGVVMLEHTVGDIDQEVEVVAECIWHLQSLEKAQVVEEQISTKIRYADVSPGAIAPGVAALPVHPQSPAQRR
jgi:hypothetical protein